MTTTRWTPIRVPCRSCCLLATLLVGCAGAREPRAPIDDQPADAAPADLPPRDTRVVVSMPEAGVQADTAAVRDADTVDTARPEPDTRADLARGDAPPNGSMDAPSADVAPTATDSGGTPADGKPVFVAVGYAGRTIRSTDLGQTWTDEKRLGGGGDDEFLLRAVTFGNGLFVAVGWKILTSTDGATWTERRNPTRQWIGGVKWGNGRFAAAGGYGDSWQSDDGVTWQAGGRRGTEAARSVAFGAGKWTAATDPGNWWESTDGRAWTRASGGHATNQVIFCGDRFSEPSGCMLPIARNSGRTAFGEGIHVSVRGSTLERSADGGKTWTVVHRGSTGLEGVAFGYVK